MVSVSAAVSEVFSSSLQESPQLGSVSTSTNWEGAPKGSMERELQLVFSQIPQQLNIHGRF